MNAISQQCYEYSMASGGDLPVLEGLLLLILNQNCWLALYYNLCSATIGKSARFNLDGAWQSKGFPQRVFNLNLRFSSTSNRTVQIWNFYIETFNWSVSIIIGLIGRLKRSKLSAGWNEQANYPSLFDLNTFLDAPIRSPNSQIPDQQFSSLKHC